MRACNNASLPGQRLPFLVGRHAVGWVSDRIAQALLGMPGIVCSQNCIALTDPAALPDLAWDLSVRGLYRWRGEAFDVRAHPDGSVLTKIDRGAIPSFGIQAAGVHVNGLVHRPDGLHLWIARRANDKLLDPGKLDNVVAGGVPAGFGILETLVKEAAEEASIPAALAVRAVRAGVIEYAMDRAEGLRRDVLHCYDLVLPDDFIPVAADGEVEAFELWPLARALAAVRDTDDFKFNVNLVLIDLFIRTGTIAGPEAADLRAALSRD